MAPYLRTWQRSHDIFRRASCDTQSTSGCPMTSTCPEVGHFRRNDLNWQVNGDALNKSKHYQRGVMASVGMYTTENVIM